MSTVAEQLRCARQAQNLTLPQVGEITKIRTDHLRALDLATGAEKPRIQVSLATRIPEERCRRINLGYIDPDTIKMDEWRNREQEGVLLVPRAGETLYRLKQKGATTAS